MNLLEIFAAHDHSKPTHKLVATVDIPTPNFPWIVNNHTDGAMRPPAPDFSWWENSPNNPHTGNTFVDLIIIAQIHQYQSDWNLLP